LKQIKVIGLGNILLSDEGIGVHVVNHLGSLKQHKNVEFLDLGTSSYEIENHLDTNVKTLVVIDCLNASHMAPGSVVKLSIEDLKSSPGIRYSLHQIELIDSLKLISIENELPGISIIGIVPFDTRSLSTEMSAHLKKKFPSILREINDLISETI